MVRYSKRFKWGIPVMMAVFVMALYFMVPSEVKAEEQTEAVLGDGVTVVTENVSNKIYNVVEGKAVAVKGSLEGSGLVLDNCIFNLSGKTMDMSETGVGSDGTKSKLAIGNNVKFINCTINVNSGSTSSDSGQDAAITMHSGEILFDNTDIAYKDWNGQGMGLYNSADVKFKDCNISNIGNKNGWCYAMYGKSELTLDNSNMSATGMTIEKDNTNAFYSGDSAPNHVNILNGSKVNFHDNKAGGFAVPNVRLYVSDSEISVVNNAGNASNSGYWDINDSKITIAGNKAHGWSHQSDTVKGSEINIIHNGYAGYYISGDSTWEDSKINIRCNGERLKSYSGKDLTLNGHTLTLKDCGIAWIGAVGNSGKVKTEGNTKVIAYDIDESGLKKNTSPVLTDADMALADIDKDGHVLFLNPEMEADYARGFDKDSDDADIQKNLSFEDENMKIGKLTEAQLSHHEYDWEANNPEDIIRHATEESYGVKKIKCKVCNEFVSNSEEHSNGSDCEGTFVYAPLVAVEFDTNMGDEAASWTEELTYGEKVAAPENPVREGYKFKGWFLDREFNDEFDFDTELTDNYTILYAKWEKVESSVVDDPEPPATTGSVDQDIAPKTGDEKNISLIVLVMMLSLAGASTLIFRRYKKNL